MFSAKWAPFRFKPTLRAQHIPFHPTNVFRPRAAPSPTSSRLFGSSAHSNGGFWQQQKQPDPLRRWGAGAGGTGGTCAGRRAWLFRVVMQRFGASAGTHRHHQYSHNPHRNYHDYRFHSHGPYFHQRTNFSYKRFWAGEGAVPRREMHRILWGARIKHFGQSLWRFRMEDRRRKGGQHCHMKKMCRRRRRENRLTQDQKTGLAYFLSTEVPRANPDPPSFYQQNYFLRSASASASLHSASSPPRPSPYTPAPQSPHHHPTAPPSSSSLMALPMKPMTHPMPLHFHPSDLTPPQASDPCFEAALPLLLPFVALLKSSAALKVITLVSRVALTLLPLSVRAKVIYSIRERYLRNPTANEWMRRMIERGGKVTANGASMRLNSQYLLPFLLSLPFLLLGGIIAASYERTPVTGRPRIVMLSPAEEADLVSSILDVGATTREGSRDWVTILRSVLDLGDEGISTTTGRRMLLGGEVLDGRDWRVRWTDAVLRALEAGVPSLASGKSETIDGVLPPPPTSYPLSPRAAPAMGVTSKLGINAPLLVADYDLLVIDRKEANAFSFGFGPEAANGLGRRGVIVVYSGFIDEILGYSSSSVPDHLAMSTAPGIFGSFLPSRKATEPNLTTTPTTLPTALQTKSLAVLLSHELAHLVLSHTLESYASTSLLIPQLSKLGSDVLRTLIYPVTALLGPFLNDSIGASLNVGAARGFGALGQAVNSCSSRQLEGEADVVALRLLSHSGIDPRYALNFWEDRLSAPPPSTSDPPPPSSHLLRLHSASLPNPSMPGNDRHGPDGACGFLATHPVNSERVAVLRAELQKWVQYASTTTLA
ncbi:hypothetical protein P7C70_g4889, partial [Phenoliferia sp. Uapishka_3]